MHLEDLKAQVRFCFIVIMLGRIVVSTLVHTNAVQQCVTSSSLGLATEFMSRKMALKVYGKNGPSGYAQIAADFHRMRCVYQLYVCSVLCHVL